MSFLEIFYEQVRINKFLEKTKQKTRKSKNQNDEDSGATGKEQEKLRMKVTDLLKKKKLPAVRKIVKGQDDSKPWNRDTKAKVIVVSCKSLHRSYCFLTSIIYRRVMHACIFQVGSRLIELLIETAYIQSPADQLADGLPDIRPAFVHTTKTTREGK